MEEYLINVEDILDYKACDLIHWISNYKGKSISELKIKDLVLNNNSAIRSGNGVYVFKSKDQIIYVGNCVSRSFLERIPAHFDIRHNGWFHSLLLTLIKKGKGENYNEKTEKEKDKSLELAAKEAFEELELILINFSNYNKKSINELEKLFKMALNPLNGYKTKVLDNRNVTVREFIE